MAPPVNNARAPGDMDLQRRRLSMTAKAEAQQAAPKREGRRSVAGQLPNGREGSFSSAVSDSAESEQLLDLGGGFVCRWAALTRAGQDPGRVKKTNQDAWAVEEAAPGGRVVLGVFDGHGFNGERVSQSVAAKVPSALVSSLAGGATGAGPCVEAALCEAFEGANRAVMDTNSYNVQLSGSTGVVCVAGGGRLTVANVGDSRSFVARGAGVSLDVDELNVEHKPTDPAEAARIEQSGGAICPFEVDGEPVGPPRVWVAGEDGPGLCMTRAFGDGMAHSVGVHATPTLVHRDLQGGDKLLVMCSDGITEFIEPKEVATLVQAVRMMGASPFAACQAMVDEARKRWEAEEEDVIDDCTILVAYLDEAEDGA